MRQVCLVLPLPALLTIACQPDSSSGPHFANPHRDADHDDSGGAPDTEDDTANDTGGATHNDTGEPLSTDTGDGANPQGIDVSHWDEAIDWGAVRADDISFAYIKATEGVGFTDPNFDDNYDAADRAGVVRGAYHFANPGASDGAAQADYFVEHGGGWVDDGRTLPGALDLEWNPYGEGDDCYDLSTAEMTAWITDFVAEYEALTGRPPVIYCGASWWGYCVDDRDFSASPLWVASWDDPEPELPSGWSEHAIWQYGAVEVAGVSVEAEINVFAGSDAKLARFAAGGG